MFAARLLRIPILLSAQAVVLAMAHSVLFAQVPLVDDTVYVRREAGVAAMEWRGDAASLALESGLSATAVELYEALLADVGIQDRELLEPYRWGLVAALVAQGEFSQAEEVLDLVTTQGPDARWRLYRAIVSYGLDADALEASIAPMLVGIDPTELDPIDLPWLYLLRGAVADVVGDAEQAREYYLKAEDFAASRMQRAFFSSMALRQKMLLAEAEEGVLVEIRAKLDSFSGQPAAFPFLREYVVLLHRLDRDGEALEALEAGLANTGAGYSREERAELLLLKGLILGSNSEAGWSALKELVRVGAVGDSTAMALQLLARADGREAELMVFLNEIISGPEPHPLLGMLYYIRCQLALANPETAAIAEADARYLLEQFPGLDEITNVYRLLAYGALRRSPPQYRVAADYLLNLRDQGAGQVDLAELNRMIGDCYFMNGDYENAVDFYTASRAASVNESAINAVFLRLIISEIRSGMLEAALIHVDEADFSGSMDRADRWRAEWNIAQALQADGQIEVALERVRSLIEGQGTGGVAAALDMRLRWLEAHLSLVLKEDAILERIAPLLARLESLPEGALDPDESMSLKTELQFLQAQALVQSEDVEAGFSVMSDLRDSAALSVAAQRSYFFEAAYHASIGDFRSAQQVLVDFSLKYPLSLLAQQALFQAALHCERRGPESYPEAALLLDQLVQDYPDSQLIYYSGLRQGDLLRLMNDFAGAQLIYENLIKAYPGHELRYIAELSRADCIAALAQGDDVQMLEAAAILERLLDTPDLPSDFHVEVGHKWGTILQERGEVSDAREVFGLITARYMLDAQNALGLESVGRYWLSRTVFSLGEMLEEAGEVEEAKRLYRKMVAFNLPGRNLAMARVDRLQLGENR